MIIPLFIKTPKNIFSYGLCQCDKNLAYAMLFNVYEVPEWVIYFWNLWNQVESQLFEKLSTESIKGKSKYMHDNLKTQKGCLKTNFLVKIFIFILLYMNILVEISST